LNEISNVLPEIRIIAGPTASGKTAAAVAYARKIGAEIISADSMQIYEGLPIATAKPTAAELEAVPHHLVGIIPRSEEFSVAAYVKLAESKAEDIIRRGKTPLIVGGTGLYITSLINGIDFSEKSDDKAVRESLRADAEKDGNKALWERLAAVDPAAAAVIAPENTVRIIRALEVIEVTGRKFSDYKNENKKTAGTANSAFALILSGLMTEKRFMSG
jgi:tRNA dimethylallyltransferase